MFRAAALAGRWRLGRYRYRPGQATAPGAATSTAATDPSAASAPAVASGSPPEGRGRLIPPGPDMGRKYCATVVATLWPSWLWLQRYGRG